MPMLPACVITNLLRPELDALKRSPPPELSTMSAETLLLPLIDAIGKFSLSDFTSSADSGSAMPMPILPSFLIVIDPILRLSDRVDGEIIVFILCQKPTFVASGEVKRLLI